MVAELAACNVSTHTVNRVDVDNNSKDVSNRISNSREATLHRRSKTETTSNRIAGQTTIITITTSHKVINSIRMLEAIIGREVVAAAVV